MKNNKAKSKSKKKPFFENKLSTWIAIISSLTGIILFVISIYYSFIKIIDNTVNERFKYYHHLFTGLALVQDEEFDRAAIELRSAFQLIKDENPDRNTLTPLLNTYLLAISSSEDIKEFIPDFKKIIPYVREEIPFYGWQQDQVGWFYFRTKKISEAENNFSEAIKRYEEDDEFFRSSHTYWALMWVNLAKNDISKALLNLKEANRRNPADYQIKIIVEEAPIYKYDMWYKHLMKLYPNLEESLIQLIFQVKIEYNIK